MPYKDPEVRRVKQAAYRARKRAEDPEAWAARVNAEARARRHRDPKRVESANQRWAKRHPEKYKAKMERTRLRQYGLTPETYAQMVAAQGGVCAICSKPCTTFPRLSVDHDHATNTVRGLLCSRCNFMIGYGRDTPQILRAGAEYLERHGKRAA